MVQDLVHMDSQAGLLASPKSESLAVFFLSMYLLTLLQLVLYVSPLILHMTKQLIS